MLCIFHVLSHFNAHKLLYLTNKEIEVMHIRLCDLRVNTCKWKDWNPFLTLQRGKELSLRNVQDGSRAEIV